MYWWPPDWLMIWVGRLAVAWFVGYVIAWPLGKGVMWVIRLYNENAKLKARLVVLGEGHKDRQ
jgi:hypothetical protein